MKVLVDTTIWSLALRRRPESLGPLDRALVDEWRRLVRRAHVGIVGPIRQEILSGIRTHAQFELLRKRLSAFPNTSVEEVDYEAAAELFNVCRAHGVAGTPVDMLLCAVARRTKWPIFTTDADFVRYAAHVPIRLHAPTRAPEE